MDPDEVDERPDRRRWWRAAIPAPDEMDAYERVLGDAMAGDATLFAREDYVEEAWRIVDPVLKAGTPVYEYEPAPGDRRRSTSRVSPPGGWQNPGERRTMRIDGADRMQTRATDEALTSLR